MKRQNTYINLSVFFVFFMIFFQILFSNGFDIPPHNDSYAVRTLVDHGTYFRLDDITRFFGFVPTVIGHFLDPAGFVGTNIVLMLLNIFRVFFIYLILKHFSSSWSFAFLASLLYAACFTDVSFLWQGALGLHFGVTTHTLASLLFIYAVKSEGSKGLLLTALCSIVLLVSLFTYPSYIVLATGYPVVASLLLRRKKWLPMAVWYASILAAGITYVNSMANNVGRNSNVSSFNIDMVMDGYKYFFGTYTDKISDIADASILYNAAMYIIPLAAIVVSIFLYKKGSAEWSSRINVKSFVLYTLLALVFMVVNYLPYAVSDVRFKPMRIFLLPDVGFAIIIAAFIFLIISQIKSQKSAMLVYTIVTCLLFAGFYNQKIKIGNDFISKNMQMDKYMCNALKREHDITDKLVVLDIVSPYNIARAGAMIYVRPELLLNHYYDIQKRKITAVTIPARKVKRVRFDKDGAYFPINKKNKKAKFYPWEDVLLYSFNRKNGFFPVSNTGNTKYFNKLGIDVKLNYPKFEHEGIYKERLARMKKRHDCE